VPLNPPIREGKEEGALIPWSAPDRQTGTELHTRPFLVLFARSFVRPVPISPVARILFIHPRGRTNQPSLRLLPLLPLHYPIGCIATSLRSRLNLAREQEEIKTCSHDGHLRRPRLSVPAMGKKEAGQCRGKKQDGWMDGLETLFMSGKARHLTFRNPTCIPLSRSILLATFRGHAGTFLTSLMASFSLRLPPICKSSLSISLFFLLYSRAILRTNKKA